MAKNINDRLISSWRLAFIVFSAIFGFSHIITSFAYFGQTQSIGVWLIIIVVFFVPYAMIVGELGSVFPDVDSGLSGWVKKTVGSNMAFMCGWIVWAGTLPYLSERPNAIVINLNWIFFQNGNISNISPVIVQAIGIVIFILCAVIASNGFKVIKVFSFVAGTSIFVISLLYIILGIIGYIYGFYNTDINTYKLSLDISNFYPSDWSCLMMSSMLILSITGVELVSPYIKNLKKPSRDFPKAMIICVVIISLCLILGILVMATMFGQHGEEVNEDFLTNGQYYAFQKLGEYFNVGNIFLLIYSVVRVFGEASALILFIDLPLRLFLENKDTKRIPRGSLKVNKNGVHIYWLIAESILVIVLMIAPVLGIEQTDILVQWLIKIIAICTPMYLIFSFIAYIKLKSKMNYLCNPKKCFIFIKNRYLAIVISSVCLICISASIIMQIYSADTFQFLLNVVITLFVICSGILLPFYTKYYNKRHNVSKKKGK